MGKNVIKLSVKNVEVSGPEQSKPLILRVTTNKNLPEVIRDKYAYVINDGDGIPPHGFNAYLCFTGGHKNSQVKNIFYLSDDMDYLADGDVVRLVPGTGEVKAMFRKNAQHNAILLTDRCNSYCLMCSQPPRDIDDSYLLGEISDLIPLIDRSAKEICFTGGEPTLCGDGFFELVKKCKNYLPETSLHILSNGRTFSDHNLAKQLSDIKHPDIMIGVPLYSDVSHLHDFIVQAEGAFDQTIKGLLNLKSRGVRVEIRVVIHKQTYSRLPQLAEFISRNLTFVDHVALMGLEMTGFTKANFEALWIDPANYQNELREAVTILSLSNIYTSIYNHQLCLLKPSLAKYAVKSISDWKNEYMPECAPCLRKHECGGFFSSAKMKFSDSIRPFTQ